MRALLRRRWPGDVDAISTHLERGGSANVVVNDLTLLQWACAWSDVALVELLLANGAGIDRVVYRSDDLTGRTALMIAVRASKPVAVVGSLVKGRANLEAVDPEGRTALMHVCESARGDSSRGDHARQEVVQLLLSARADPKARSSNIRAAGHVHEGTALQAAWPNLCECFGADRGAVAKMLIRARADVDERRRGGKTLLLWAAYKGNAEMLRFCQDQGADPKATGA